MPQPVAIDVLAHIAERRAFFGDDFVAGRIAPEAAARTLLNEAAGRMSREQAIRFGELLNEHKKATVVRHDRFAPAFVGASLAKVTEDLETFNQRVELLWTGDDEAALRALDETLRNRALFPGAGSSLPSVLMYLRDPDRYAVWITATINGLRQLTGDVSPSKSGGQKSYLQFCEQVRRFREKYGLAPQEVDAILARPPLPPPSSPRPPAETAVVADASVEALAAACSLPVEEVEEWVSLLHGPKRQAVFYGPPGTGKTHVAGLLADHLAGSAERVRTVQFHPSYSYEDLLRVCARSWGRRVALSSPMWCDRACSGSCVGRLGPTVITHTSWSSMN